MSSNGDAKVEARILAARAVHTVSEGFSFLALFQSSRNFFSPMSVSGCTIIFSMTSGGMVAIPAPSFAASSTC